MTTPKSYSLDRLLAIANRSALIRAVHTNQWDNSHAGLGGLAGILDQVALVDPCRQADLLELTTTLIRLRLFGVHEVLFQDHVTGQGSTTELLTLPRQRVLQGFLANGDCLPPELEHLAKLQKEAATRRSDVKKIIEVLGGVSELLRAGGIRDLPVSAACRIYRLLVKVRLVEDAHWHAITMLANWVAEGLSHTTTPIGGMDVHTARAILGDAIAVSSTDWQSARFAWAKGSLELGLHASTRALFDPAAAVGSFRFCLQHAPAEKAAEVENMLASALFELAKKDNSKNDEAIDALVRMRPRLDIDGLFALGHLLMYRLTHAFTEEDAVLARQVWSEIVSRAGSDLSRAQAQANLATVLELDSDEDASGLNQAILLRRKALPLITEVHTRFQALFLTIKGLVKRYAEQQRPDDLHEARIFMDEAFSMGLAPDYPAIAVELLAQYAQTVDAPGWFEQRGPVQHSLRLLFRKGVLPPALKLRALILHQVVLDAIRVHTRSASDLKLAIENCSLGLGIAEKHSKECGTAYVPIFLRARGICRLDAYDLSGRVEDLQLAQADLALAVSLTDDPAFLGSYSVGLMSGVAEHQARKPAIDQTIDRLELALAKPTSGGAEWLYWSLGNLLLQSYRTGGVVADLHRALSSFKQAGQTLSPSVYPKLALSESQALYNLFLLDRQIESINDAISLAEAALENIPLTTGDRWEALVTLSNAYQERFNLSSCVDDSIKAVSLLEEAMTLSGPASPYRPMLAGNLLGALVEQYAFGDDAVVLARAVDISKTIAPSPAEALQLEPITANSVAVARSLISSTEEEKTAWSRVFETLSRQQEHDVEASLRPAQNWVHHSFRNGFWPEVLNAYEHIRKLRERVVSSNSGFVDRAAILRRFQQYGTMAALSLIHQNQFERAAQLLNENQARLLRSDAVVAGKVSCSPDRLEELWEHVTQVWYVGATMYGGFALSLSPSGARAVVIPELTLEMEQKWYDKPTAFLDEIGRHTVDKFDVPTGAPANVMLVPIGSLSSLPWAAVPFRGARLIDSVCLRVLPSTDFFRPAAGRVANAALIEVLDAPGHGVLRHAVAETAQLGAWLPDHQTLRGNTATRNAAIDAVRHCDLIHFACHGIAHAERPGRSALLLAQQDTLSIEELSRIEPVSGSLVFLSACETAYAGSTLPDEFANLAAAFLALGFSTAIGSLSKVNDSAASVLARRFYWYFLHEGRNASSALRDAQLWLRDTPATHIAEWLETLGPPCNDAEAGLRSNLKKDGTNLRFGATKYWAPYVCYGF
jgi:tetratricopeptide (TPR) repeat protein